VVTMTERNPVIYRGYRNTSLGAQVDRSDEKKLDPRWDLRNHSPDGFEWGYGGSGPSQLALAIIADTLRDRMPNKPEADRMTMMVYQDFKWHVIQGLAYNTWQLAQDAVFNWFLEHVKKFEPKIYAIVAKRGE
jgi:hypothetical protein